MDRDREGERDGGIGGLRNRGLEEKKEGWSVKGVEGWKNGELVGWTEGGTHLALMRSWSLRTEPCR